MKGNLSRIGKADKIDKRYIKQQLTEKEEASKRSVNIYQETYIR